MASQYDMAQPPDNPGSYASLPGTSGVAFVQQNMTPMKSLLEAAGEVTGCHPARWIHEVINNDFTACDVFDRAREANPGCAQVWNHQHRLVINGNQSFKVASAQTLSSVCLDCHFHFVFKMKWEEQHNSDLCNATKSGWPLADSAFPWHHLAWVRSATDDDIINWRSDDYPLLAVESFVCSAPPCTFEVTLEISEPRMPQSWIQLLKDHDAIREELKNAKARDPDRYQGSNDDWIYQGPMNLNTYLKNQLEATPETTRSISKRNKSFAVLFGKRCAPIFKGLRFKETVIDNAGVDEGSITPPAPGPATGPLGTTELATYRAFIEDVRAEIQCLIHKAGLTAERPSFCASSLYSDMGCTEVPDSSANAFNALDRYKLLGVLATQDREVVVNAYKRQWDLLPSRRKALVEALMSVANDSRDELLSDYAITQSSVFDSQPTQQNNTDADGDSMISQSLAFLALQPPNNYSAEAIIAAFRKKLAEDPAEATTARSVLMWIAQSSNDDMYQAHLLMEADAKMSLDTAKAVLGISTTDDVASVTVDKTKEKLRNSKSTEATDVYLDALDAVAEHTASPALKQAVMELRHSYAAYGSIALTEGTNKSAVDYDVPVGLDNIGNTCYLNSLLQYLYTVEPVRDVVLNYPDVELGLFDDSIQQRRIGGNKMQMDRGEAVVAHAFAQELAELFNNLHCSDRSATRPSQRLANAVLLSTHTLLDSAKQQGEQRQVPPEPAAVQQLPLADKRSETDAVVGEDAMDITSADGKPGRGRSVSSTETLVDADEPEGLSTKNAKSDELKTAEPDHVDAAAVLVSTTDSTQPLSAPKSNPEDEKATDTVMEDIAEPETVDQRVLNALEHQKRSSGTDQQDVEEVMGSIINRLQAAIRPSSIDEKTGIQLEKIMETFFVTTINYTKKFDEKEYQQEVSFDRSITAFPATDGPCSLYDALGRNFDQQILEESKLSRYTAIKTLPPILHILIQRTQSTGSKNGNAVIIPETLYLDRYMDTPHDSPEFQRRVEDWVTADRMADVKSQMAQLDTNPSYHKYLEHYGSQPGSASDNSTWQQELDDTPVVVPEENWDFDGPVEDDFILVSSAKDKEAPVTPPIKPVEGIQRTHVEIKAMMEQEIKDHEQTLLQNAQGQTKVPYRLHAVICHRGHLMSGHYWVWIYDFEQEVWRWYNDEAVKENKNTGEVLQTLSTGGEPYFLCYVRDDDKEKYVGVPKRQRPPTPEPAKEDVAADYGGQETGIEAVDLTESAALTPATEIDDDGDIVVESANDAAAGDSMESMERSV